MAIPFQFAYNLDGSNTPPAVMKLPLNSTTAILEGDGLVVNSAGKLVPIAGSVTEVTAIALQARPSTGAADGDLIKVAIVRKSQVWRCSADASTTTAVNNGFNKTLDVTTAHTVKVSATTGGTLQAWDVSKKDDAGNIMAYVSFTNTTSA